MEVVLVNLRIRAATAAIITRDLRGTSVATVVLIVVREICVEMQVSKCGGEAARRGVSLVTELFASV